jgi:hypothetical protein
MADRVLSKEHIKKRKEIAAVLAKSAPKGKRGFGSAVDRLAIDVLYELLVVNKAGLEFLKNFEQRYKS